MKSGWGGGQRAGSGYAAGNKKRAPNVDARSSPASYPLFTRYRVLNSRGISASTPSDTCSALRALTESPRWA